MLNLLPFIMQGLWYRKVQGSGSGKENRNRIITMVSNGSSCFFHEMAGGYVLPRDDDNPARLDAVPLGYTT